MLQTINIEVIKMQNSTTLCKEKLMRSNWKIAVIREKNYSKIPKKQQKIKVDNQ